MANVGYRYAPAPAYPAAAASWGPPPSSNRYAPAQAPATAYAQDTYVRTAQVATGGYATGSAQAGVVYAAAANGAQAYASPQARSYGYAYPQTAGYSYAYPQTAGYSYAYPQTPGYTYAYPQTPGYSYAYPQTAGYPYAYPQTAGYPYAYPQMPGYPYAYPQTAAYTYAYPQTAGYPYAYPQTAAYSYAYPQTAGYPYAYPQTAPTQAAPAQAAALPYGTAASHPGNPNAYFICQTTDPTWNPGGPASSANCGPTSLAMALRAFGKLPPGLTDGSNAESVIEWTRYAMTGADVVGTDTDLNQLQSGAQKSGLKTQVVQSVDQVAAALAAGQLVIAAGNQAAYNGRFADNQLTHFGTGGHFILVTGFDGTNFTINDPLSHVGAITVSKAELASFMAYQNWNAGLALSP